MFAYDANSSFDSEHLTGMIPEIAYYFGDGIILNDTF
jgi:hypothetical protein